MEYSNYRQMDVKNVLDFGTMYEVDYVNISLNPDNFLQFYPNFFIITRKNNLPTSTTFLISI